MHCPCLKIWSIGEVKEAAPRRVMERVCSFSYRMNSLSRNVPDLGFELPAAGTYGVGMVFFPRDKKVMNACREVLRKNIKELGLELLGYRVVPVDHSVPGPGAAEVEPTIEQVFVKAKDDYTDKWRL